MTKSLPRQAFIRIFKYYKQIKKVMIKFIKDIVTGINSSDGLESTMSLIILVGIIIPVLMLIGGIVSKLISLFY